jgi:glutathione S-transferase
MIDLYTAPTPNGWKASMALEELEVPYTPHVIDLSRGQQRSPEFLALNPNGRIPAMIDRDDPRDTKGRYEVVQWLMFQMSGIGPMQGQAVAFVRYFPEEVPQAIQRYHNETRRLYEVLERRLEDRDYLAGDYSIADIANYSWVRSHKWARVGVDGLPNLQRWMDDLAARPGIQRGCQVPPSPGKADLVKAGGAAITTT